MLYLLLLLPGLIVLVGFVLAYRFAPMGYFTPAVRVLGLLVAASLARFLLPVIGFLLTPTGARLDPSSRVAIQQVLDAVSIAGLMGLAMLLMALFGMAVGRGRGGLDSRRRAGGRGQGLAR